MLAASCLVLAACALHHATRLAAATAAMRQGSAHWRTNSILPATHAQILMREFGRFGPIGSVKVMWPRDEEQRRRGRNTGFVSFMVRGPGLGQGAAG